MHCLRGGGGGGGMDICATNCYKHLGGVGVIALLLSNSEYF